MTKRNRRILWGHVKGIAHVLLQLIGVAAIYWAIFVREPAPTIIPPSVADITIEGVSK